MARGADTSTGFVAIVIAATILLLADASTAQEIPELRCATPASIAEQVICRNRRFAAVENGLRRRHARLLAMLSADARGALEQDQRAFDEARTAAFRRDQRGGEAFAQTVERLRFLQGVRPRPPGSDPQSLVGTWGNVRGGVQIKSGRLGRLSVVIETGDPVGRAWRCRVTGRSSVAAGGLQLTLADVVVRLARRGGRLVVEEEFLVDRIRRRTGHCSGGGTVAGDYFPIEFVFAR